MTAALASAPWAFLLRALIEPSMFHLMQTVQKRPHLPTDGSIPSPVSCKRAAHLSAAGAY